MTLEEIKLLLKENGLQFEQIEYKSEREWLSTVPYACTKHAKLFKVIILSIHSNNGKKHIELQFNHNGTEFVFYDLYFGDYAYEMFDYNEDILSSELIDNIKVAMSGRQHIINVVNLKKQRWCGDGSFIESDDEDEDDSTEYFAIIKRIIEEPKPWLSKLFKTKKQYEIYDWNDYRCIVK